MPNSDFWKQPTISIAQAAGFVVMMFGAFSFYYNSDNTTKIVDNFVDEEEEYKEENRAVHAEHKELVYQKFNEANAKTGRMVYPVEEDLENLRREDLKEIWAWINYRKGVIDTEERLGK